jgi:hypothetical protein
MNAGSRHLDRDLQVYDDFDKPGYSLDDYAEKWTTPYGLGEMAVKRAHRLTTSRR